VKERAVTRSEAKFLDYIKKKSGMPDASELERLRDILDRMEWQHIFSWAEPKKSARSD
jgi:hypothetical protein